MKMESLPSKKVKKDLLLLKDGESATGMVIGDFHTFYAKFNGKFYENVPRGTEGGKFRFRVTFAIKNGSTYQPKVLEQGADLYKKLYETNEQFPLEETMLIIKRKGSTAMDTEYTVTPINPNKVKLSKEEAAFLAEMKPLQLADEEVDELAFLKED